MISNYILSLFLYFPEDKTEYIPALITMFIFMIIAALTMRFFIKYSKKEAEKTKALEESLLNQVNEDNKDQNPTKLT